MFLPLSPFAVPAAIAPPGAVVNTAAVYAPAILAPVAPQLPEIDTAAALEQAALDAGFAVGFSPTLPPAARQVDLEMVRRMRCPACHKRGLEAKPFHRLRDLRYRLVCSCASCGAGEIA